jgi:hypothetical protein
MLVFHRFWRIPDLSNAIYRTGFSQIRTSYPQFSRNCGVSSGFPDGYQQI